MPTVSKGLITESLDELESQPRASPSKKKKVSRRRKRVRRMNEGGPPVRRFNGNLLIKQFAPLLEHEVAPLSLVTISSTKGTYERPLRI
jgi:hypothetical protein